MVSLSLESTKGGVAAKNASGTSELVPLRQTFRLYAYALSALRVGRPALCLAFCTAPLC
jgi:hypothetical protein